MHDTLLNASEHSLSHSLQSVFFRRIARIAVNCTQQGFHWKSQILKFFLRRKGPTLLLGVPWLIRITGAGVGG